MTDTTDLDHLLAAWADEQRLDATAAEAVRHAILAEPRELPAAWWTEFGTWVGDAMARAADSSTSGFAAAGWLPEAA